LIASPSSVAENSMVCLRQRVSPEICSMSRAAQIQHAIRFVEDQCFDRTAVKILFFNVLQQSACGCDHDILVSLNTSAWFI
jgi:hypothetical protein